MGKERQCSACGAQLEGGGLELWGSWFCSTCFISNASKLHRELTPDDIKLLRTIGRELAGLLPPDLLEMVLVGFYRRGTGGQNPPTDELERCVGEIQRLCAFAAIRKVMNLTQTWKQSMDELVETQEREMRQAVKTLTEGQ